MESNMTKYNPNYLTQMRLALGEELHLETSRIFLYKGNVYEVLDICKQAGVDADVWMVSYILVNTPKPQIFVREFEDFKAKFSIVVLTPSHSPFENCGGSGI